MADIETQSLPQELHVTAPPNLTADAVKRHTCRAAWAYGLTSVLLLGVSLAADGTPAATGVSVEQVTDIVMTGGFGALALAELSRWRELGQSLVKLLDSALEDLREGRMSVRHEHVDMNGKAAERRRPQKTTE